MNKEQIVYKKIDELKLNPKNPRKNDGAVDSVLKSIEKYGFKNPLIVDEKGIVWCGNTRLKAAKKLGLKEAPCIIVTDLTEKQMREYALLDNKTNEIADWDFDMLQEELDELDFSDFDFDWGIEDKIEENRKDISDTIKDSFELIVDCKNEQELQNLYDEFNKRGYVCKISTL